MPVIAKAEVVLLSIPFAGNATPVWSFGGTPKRSFDTLLVRLETDDGIVGWGEAFSRDRDIALRNLIQTRVLPSVIGRDASQLSSIKRELEFQYQNFGRCGPLQYGVAAVDIALWDILGKRAGLPLVDLLGGAYAEKLEVYASLLRYGDGEKVAEAVREAVNRGYRAIKLHELGTAEIRAAVEAAGTDVAVSLDVNCPWTVAGALAKDRELADLGLAWLEEPVWPPEDYAGLSRLRREGVHRIAAGENAGSLHDFASMVALGAIDIAQPDIAKAGGLSEMREIASLCLCHGLEFIPHCAIFGPGQIGTIHLSASLPATPMLERLYLDFEVELYGGANVPVDGHVAVPSGHGLGLEPDPGVIAEYRIEE